MSSRHIRRNPPVFTQLRPTNDFYRADETYVKGKDQWKYLYRAVDSQGDTLDFLLSTRRDQGH